MDPLTCDIPDDLQGWRVDAALAEQFPEYSRGVLQNWIRQGRVRVNGQGVKPSGKLVGGEHIELFPELVERVECEPQPVDLDVVYEDEDLLVINKPANLVMHPAAGNPDGTVQNGLLQHDRSLAHLPRAGIVHRLDKDTTGLFVVARNLRAHASLVAQLQARTVHREYRALISGVMVAGGSVDAPIGRHPRDRKRMAVVDSGRPAVTHYRILEKFTAHTSVSVELETGRTHQIRVHMAHLHYPLIGDPVYAGRLRIPAGVGESLAEQLRAFPRQALHAIRLQLQHPSKREPVQWEVPLPDDFRQLLNTLRDDANTAN
ncbi:MAG: 23S rRNA pseudouridine(1911/1915/1917) synthase RluD [Pseudomonadota bacterium]